jgi:hypothetical protein
MRVQSLVLLSSSYRSSTWTAFLILLEHFQKLTVVWQRGCKGTRALSARHGSIRDPSPLYQRSVKQLDVHCHLGYPTHIRHDLLGFCYFKFRYIDLTYREEPLAR